MADRKHLEERRPKYQRRMNRFEPRQSILIVCEGEKTEPNYFLRFPIPPDSVVVVKGLGANTASLVRRAIQLMSGREYQQVWCVFDRDSFTAENFNLAFQLANARGIKVAYSNEAFELWYVLHFDYLNSGIDRNQYIGRLCQLLGFPYQKNDPRMYDLLSSRQGVAIRNAARLLSEYPEPNPERDNPSTTVHLLVEQLNRLFWDE